MLRVHETHCDILTFSATLWRIILYSAFRFLGTNMCLQMESNRQPEVASVCKVLKQLFVSPLVYGRRLCRTFPDIIVSFPLNMVVFRSAADCVSDWVVEWQIGGVADTFLHLSSILRFYFREMSACNLEEGADLSCQLPLVLFQQISFLSLKKLHHYV